MVGMPSAARNALITAKGNENIVCGNLIKSSNEAIFLIKPVPPVTGAVQKVHLSTVITGGCEAIYFEMLDNQGIASVVPPSQ